MRAVRSGAHPGHSPTERPDPRPTPPPSPTDRRRRSDLSEGAVSRTDRPSPARTLLRGAGAAPAALVGVLLTAGPALADHNPIAPQEGADEHAGIPIGLTLLLYGLLPLVMLVVVGALAYLPGGGRSARYRPTRGWSAAPVWFAGPADPVAAVETAQPRPAERGGASGDW